MEDTNRQVIIALLKTHYNDAEGQRRYLAHQLIQPIEFRVTELEDDKLQEAMEYYEQAANRYKLALDEVEEKDKLTPSWAQQ